MKKLSLLFAMTTILFVSCSKEKKLARRLDGVWNVDKIEYSYGGISFAANDPGTIEFKKDGTGKNNLSYIDEDGDKVNDSESFKWSNTENTVTINGNANSGMGSTQVWTVDDNSRKTQVWSYSFLGYTSTLTMTKQ